MYLATFQSIANKYEQAVPKLYTALDVGAIAAPSISIRCIRYFGERRVFVYVSNKGQEIAIIFNTLAGLPCHLR